MINNKCECFSLPVNPVCVDPEVDDASHLTALLVQSALSVDDSQGLHVDSSSSGKEKWHLVTYSLSSFMHRATT